MRRKTATVLVLLILGVFFMRARIYAVPMKICVNDSDGNLVFERIQTILPFENVVFKVEKTGNYTISARCARVY